MKKTLPILLAIVALITVTWSQPLAAQEEPEAEETEAVEKTENKGFMAAHGRVTFNRYCASCHGTKADGNGPVAAMLKIPPTDLRMLAASESDGEYPAERVAVSIDGQKDVRSHGSRDMPIWGEVFQTALIANPADPEEAEEERASRKVRELVLFIETIQQAPAPEEE